MGITLGDLPYQTFMSPAMAGRLGRGEDFAQRQVSGEKGGEPQRAKPQDDIKVLVDPGLRLLVVETINIIEVDGDVGVGQMGASRRSKK
jgi:hypothetical protein